MRAMCWMTWLQNSPLCWFPHVVAAVMWHDVRGCWCYAPVQHKAGYYRTAWLCHPFERRASSPVYHCSGTGHLVSVCPARLCQSVLLTSVFGNSHVPWLYLYFSFNNKWRLCSVTNPHSFASGRKHPCVSDWVYEAYQQWRMNIPGLKPKTWMSCVCDCSQTQPQIHVSCRGYKMFWKHKVIQSINSVLLFQFKHNKVEITLVVLYQDQNHYNLGQICEWDQQCKFKTYLSFSVSLSRSWGHPYPVCHLAKNQQTASTEQTAGSHCHSWCTCRSVEPQNNKQHYHWYELYMGKTHATCKTCN